MATQSKETLKSYFQTGDKPTEANFADLIDSVALDAELTTAQASVTQNVNDVTSLKESMEDLHSFVLQCSSETGQILTGDVFTFRMPINYILVDVRASLSAAPSSGTVDLTVKAGGSNITNTVSLSTTTTGANTSALLGENSPAMTIPKETEMKVNVTSAPASASGLKVTLVGRKASGTVTLSLAQINFDPDLGVPISFVDATVT